MQLEQIDAAVRERAARVRFLVLDVDGALTDGRLYYSDHGEAMKAFDVKDGLGIKLAQRAGIDFAIITGRTSKMVADRAAELGIDEVHQRILDKGKCLGEILERRGLDADQIGVIGDDLIDLPAMRMVGFAAAPADAVDEARETATYVTRAEGGRGALREVIDLVLKASGAWESVTRPFLQG